MQSTRHVRRTAASISQKSSDKFTTSIKMTTNMATLAATHAVHDFFKLLALNTSIRITKRMTNDTSI